MNQRKLDPVTFEVLRHRLWAINDEAGITIKLVSGSPIVTEGYDFNTGVLTSRGDMVIMGVYVGSHASVMDEIIRHIQEDYKDNPGINEGDMFLCNDPYYGALHQPDVTIVAPVHWDGKLVAWTGCTAHQVDVGGPVAGGWSVGATSIFQEATPIPPIKIVEGGIIRKDLEKEYLRKSRLPGLVALDLRAQIAANNVSTKRLQELMKIYGTETVLLAMEQIISYVESRFKSRLTELPDGIWRHISFLEHDGVENKVYACKLVMTKKADGLIMDFTDSSPQARGFINGCLGGLRGAIMSYLLPMLCYDMPWSPAGVGRAIKLLTKKGTIVDAEWPAAVSMATLASLWAARVAVNVCVGKMMSASPEYRDHAMSTWQGSLSGITFSGNDQRGKPMVGTLTVHMGGAGARTYKDGIDSSGYLSSLATAMPNVENTEFNYPLIYLYRNHLSDTGGAGKFRGGVSGFYAIKPHDTASPLSITVFTHGVEQPPSSGICGAYPGSTSQPSIKRNSNIEQLFKTGSIPGKLEEIGGNLEVLPAKATGQLNGEDVLEYILTGGGGFGDPIDREPDLVREDVINGLVSRDIAKELYGVILNKNGRLSLKGTQIQRKRIRAERSLHGKRKLEFTFSDNPVKSIKSIKPMSEYLELVKKDKQVYIRCRKCNTIISPAEENYKLYLAEAEYPPTRAGPHVASHVGNNRFVFREFYCPGCWTMTETETNLKGEPYIWDIDMH